MMAAGSGGEFVEGWLVAQLLGEGAYGEVRLLVHARSGACVALKVARGAGEAAAREAALHRALRHAHVLRCLGERKHADVHYTFLEYAAGGELFERIEPDVGMPVHAARRYFRQLLDALTYLHKRGVAHRDIKPENLLLDHKDDLKLSDFGMATLFRHAGRERLVSRVCGTLPYAAPEVLTGGTRPYRAPPADRWAAGVVLVAMLAGELPWERAQESDARYVAWTTESAELAGPWRNIAGAARALLRRVLRPEPERRASLSQLLQHRWLEPRESECNAMRDWRSQPAPAQTATQVTSVGDLSPADMDVLISYSQPTRADDLLLHTTATQDATQLTQGAWARLTRVRVAGSRDLALSRVADALCGAGLPAARCADRATVTVCCGADVQMRGWLVPEPEPVPAPEGEGRGTLVEFRRARGCGLAFQRRFRDVRRALRHLAPLQALQDHSMEPEPDLPTD